MSSGLAYIREHLELEPVGRGQWIALCPCHLDMDPSLNITIRPDGDGRWKLWFYCHVCDANGSAVCEATHMKRASALWPTDDDIANAQSEPKYAPPLPSQRQIDEWCANVTVDEAQLLMYWRGFTRDTIRTFGIGWDDRRNRYTLPVYDNRNLVNLKWCEHRGKLRNWAGSHGSLYPNVPDGWLLLVEGEWDALIGRQYNLPTVTTTTGCQAWPESVLSACDHRKVAICLDADQAGRGAAHKLADRLASVALAVRVVDLNGKEGYDLTDWFHKDHRTKGELIQLISARG